MSRKGASKYDTGARTSRAKSTFDGTGLARYFSCSTLIKHVQRSIVYTHTFIYIYIYRNVFMTTDRGMRCVRESGEREKERVRA